MPGWRKWILPCATMFVACGDNTTVPVGPPLAHSDVLFLGAHYDDDMIFMEPDLLAVLQDPNSSLTTVYASTAGPDGIDRHLFEASKVAYGAIAGSDDWDCGELPIASITALHCRLRDRPVSLVVLGLPDGGIPGDGLNSLLHLFDGTVSELPGYYGGRVTSDTVIDVFSQILLETSPNAIQTLELAASHGRDHSSHMFVGSIGLWAAARAAYDGPITWNRGYNVDTEPPTLDGDPLAAARTLLGYYEACADHCAPCGHPCTSLATSHEVWLARQYAVSRVRTETGKLMLGDACLDGNLSLGDCVNGATVELAAKGTLRIGDACITAAPAGGVTLSTCHGAPDQYWLLDSEGSLWNGTPPKRAGDMAYDHVRCLTDQGALACGASRQTHWRLD